ncbi:MAG: cupin domain-containing protein [Aquabacterium sp.]
MTTTARHPVIHLSDLQPEGRPAEWAPPPAVAARIEVRRAPIADALGLRLVGCNLTVVPPGKAAYPHHSHLANDELFVILEGVGQLRLGDARHALRAGDVVGCPRGDASTAHQIINTGDADLRYLSISSKVTPEICEYPDSGKVAAYFIDEAGNEFAHISRKGDDRDYWDGE